MKRKKILILGAAGRDFHNFNVLYRDNEDYEVIGFTATQIPDIANRKFPGKLAGKLYPDGIPIFPEEEMVKLIKKEKIDIVIFSYSDISHESLMHKASKIIAAGADFCLIAAEKTMIKSNKPVVAVCAVRTGCGKSPTSRNVSRVLNSLGKKVGVIRHPMPYGDLSSQAVQKFVTYEDLEQHKCTIEEREEYEPHIDAGSVVYAGVDYQNILRAAENDADIILWDGGNNDLPFIKPDFHITVADALRPGHEIKYFPGESNMIMANLILINKIDQATKESIELIKQNAAKLNPDAKVLLAESPLTVDHPELITGKKVLVVEDGPTLTHGEMDFGAGIVAARKYGASKIIDPRKYAVGKIAETYKLYPKIGQLLPAMGYSKDQIKDLEQTINATPCDVVIIATPINLKNIISIAKPTVRVQYEIEIKGKETLKDLLIKFINAK
ncbi:MAG: GTPase [Candidatus Schekmanbacteria bacterium RBG_13_48_7]|uniref:GTPase n=1 Tax=Candidatus Schekmanbacteria bacterium RBG_13_48_7 TaxID=1817878 RepID=A0A1F7S034_9BACT|nr:MAG: GTPase [Candidatus Schekmanbacteria bacterium RBG_13_48_7]